MVSFRETPKISPFQASMGNEEIKDMAPIVGNHILSIEKTYLVMQLTQTVDFAHNDCSTFIFVRENLFPHIKLPLGGGNVLMALGLFVALEVLSKLNWVLMTGKLPLGPRENPMQDNPGTPKHCFWQFISQYNAKHPDNLLGITDSNQAEKIWDGFRNKLAHILLSKGFPITHDGHKVKNIFFTEDTQTWHCCVDCLTREITNIGDYLLYKIGSDENMRIHEAYQWLQKKINQ